MVPVLPIYLDYASTTPVDPRVVEAMLPFLGPNFGNPGSLHEYGQIAAAAVDEARQLLSELVGCTKDDVIWTSGATESVNLAIKGYISAFKKRPVHIVSQTSEHRAVLDTLAGLTASGVDVTLLAPNPAGIINPDCVRRAIQPNTELVTVMAANNEIGTQAMLAEIGEICCKAGVAFHTDATQWVGKLPLSMEEANVTLLSLSGHKFYGPKGIGALVFRRTEKVKRLTPLIHGGGQERGVRSGTLNVPAIVGLGRASRICVTEMGEEAIRIRKLREMFEDRILTTIPDSFVNGASAARVPGISSVGFRGLDAESVLLALQGIAASTGSACTSTSIEPSHVLRAIGLSFSDAKATARFSFGRQTTTEQVEMALDQIISAVKALRELRFGDLI